MKRGSKWGHITYDGKTRIPKMLKGPRGLYDSGEAEDWRHDLACDCGHVWSVTEYSLGGMSVKKAYPVCCGRDECPYLEPSVRSEPRVTVTFTMPLSLYQYVDAMTPPYKNRGAAINALIERCKNDY